MNNAPYKHQEAAYPQDVFADEGLSVPVAESAETGWTLWGEIPTRVVAVGPQRIWTPVALIQSPALSQLLTHVAAA